MSGSNEQSDETGPCARCGVEVDPKAVLVVDLHKIDLDSERIAKEVQRYYCDGCASHHLEDIFKAIEEDAEFEQHPLDTIEAALDMILSLELSGAAAEAVQKAAICLWSAAKDLRNSEATNKLAN